MNTSDLRDEIDDEVSTILGADFDIIVTETSYVPHASDGLITFPNLDALEQKCKLIDTAVLYIDIRRSTELNLAHKQETVAKLYSAFVRAMTRCARHYGGHVRGIIGDRIMVIYDADEPEVAAVRTAVMMNSTAQYIINKHFKRNEVSCGIGIDTGSLLATKTGMRRKGIESHNYKSLVWLGRPANVASKLTDIANKSETTYVSGVREGLYLPNTQKWIWQDRTLEDFIKNLSPANSNFLKHKDEWFESFFPTQIKVHKKTPPILMTKTVYDAFARDDPQAKSIVNSYWSRQSVSVPGYEGIVMGGDVILNTFKP